MPEYELLAGTEPSEDTKHEPRTLRQTRRDGEVFMMTEIEDGVFVAWSDCRKCGAHITHCTCKGGPVMADYMTKWRDERFARSLRHRKPSQKAAYVPDDIDLDKPATPKADDPSDVRQKVDDGLDQAKAAVLAAKEDNSDVGF